jgi:ubiquinone biosynthesis protein
MLRIALLILLSTPAWLLVAWAGTRLIGVRRSWLAKLIAGLGGLTFGWLLALALANFDTSAEGLLPAALFWGLIFTMATAVGQDLLAKPGTLARGDEAGLIVVSNPVRDTAQRIDLYRRTREIYKIAKANGISLGSGRASNAATTEPAEVRVRHTLEQCGGVFVKLGQVASTRPDLLPPALVDELSKLQDDVAAVPDAELRPFLEEQLGAGVETVFAEFDWEPAAAASIAQVHFATLRSGERVVVKVQRPGVAELVDRDGRILVRLAAKLQQSTEEGGRFGVLAVADQFVADLREELDFRNEARAMSEMAELLVANDVEGVRIPAVHEHLLREKVMVQERFSGRPVREPGAVADADVAPEVLADRLLAVALRQMLVDGFFHADLHPGNIFVLDDGDLGLIDFGSTGRLDPLTLASLRSMLTAVVTRDAGSLRQAVSEVAEIGDDVDDDALERSLSRFMALHLAPGASIDAAAFNDLLGLLGEFRIPVPAELSTFGRALVLLEGTLRTIDPEFSLADKAASVASDLLVPGTSPDDLEALVQSELLAQLPILRRLPRQVERVLDRADKGTLTAQVSLFSRQEDLDGLGRLVNRTVLALLAASLGIGGSILLAADDGSDVVAGLAETQVIGSLVILGAATLTLRVVAAVVRDGRN